MSSLNLQGGRHETKRGADSSLQSRFRRGTVLWVRSNHQSIILAALMPPPEVDVVCWV